MSWVWTAVVLWVLLALPTAVVLGRLIRRADREEVEAPEPIPADTPGRPGRVRSSSSRT